MDPQEKQIIIISPRSKTTPLATQLKDVASQLAFLIYEKPLCVCLGSPQLCKTKKLRNTRVIVIQPNFTEENKTSKKLLKNKSPGTHLNQQYLDVCRVQRQLHSMINHAKKHNVDIIQRFEN